MKSANVEDDSKIGRSAETGFGAGDVVLGCTGCCVGLCQSLYSLLETGQPFLRSLSSEDFICAANIAVRATMSGAGSESDIVVATYANAGITNKLQKKSASAQHNEVQTQSTRN